MGQALILIYAEHQFDIDLLVFHTHGTNQAAIERCSGQQGNLLWSEIILGSSLSQDMVAQDPPGRPSESSRLIIFCDMIGSVLR